MTKELSREPANVLILVDKFDYHGSSLNGPARYYSWVVERIDRARVRPVVCALRERGDSDRLFRERGIEVVYLELGRFDPSALWRILRLVRREEIDLIHATGYGSMTLGRIAGALARVPVILHEHWVDPKIRPLHVALERALSVMPAHAIAISEYARDFLVRTKGIRADRVTLVRNGIPLGEFCDVDPAIGVAARAELDIPADACVSGIVGMFHENKGHDHFIAAAARVRAGHPDAVFVVIGDGELRADLEARARRLDLGDGLRFLGQRSDMPRMLAMLDVWVMASLSETAPLSLLEAMAAGRAIVTTDCGGPSEIVDAGASALVVPPGDPVALADAIASLITDPDRRALLGKNARAASEAFDLGHTVRRLEDVWTRTLAERA